MPNRQKEERIERDIRTISKLQENRRCVNCNCLGPQYICTTFWTFVCTSCCAIHREFSHRVKSISMTKFTSDDVGALEAGGNQRAREIYMKELDLQCNPFPDNSNPYRLRDFIKHVYIDRKYTGKNNMDRIPRLKTGHLHMKDGLSEKAGSSRMTANDKSLRSFIDARRARFSEGGGRYGSRKRSPAQFVVVDDRVKYGESGSYIKYTGTVIDCSKEKSKPHLDQTDLNSGSQAESTSDTLPPLQENAPFCGTCPINGGENFNGEVKSECLIDFNSGTESTEQTQYTPVGSGDCSIPSIYAPDTVIHVSNCSNLEYLISELAMPTLTPSDGTTAFSDNFCNFSGTGNLHMLSGNDSLQIGCASNVKNYTVAEPSLFGTPSNGCDIASVSESGHVYSRTAPFALVGSESSGYMPQNTKFVYPDAEGGASTGAIISLDDRSFGPRVVQKPFESVDVQQAQSSFTQNQSIISGFGSHPSIAEASLSARKELPLDLFSTVNIPLPQVPHCRSVQLPGIQYGTQILANFHGSSYNSAIPTNPFDFNVQLAQAQNQTFVTAGPLDSASPPFSQLEGREEDRVRRRNPFE